MRIVFQIGELKDDLEDAAGRLFEEQGGTLRGGSLVLSRINVDTQDLLFTLGDDPFADVIDLSPVVTDESAGDDPDLDDVNPDA